MRLILATSLMPLACILPAQADEPAATPYRPTVSNPAQLPVPGWLEIEAGVQSSRGPDSPQQSLPYLLKLAFSDRFGILLGGDAYLSSPDENGVRKRGFGDSSLTLKGALPVSKTTVLGLELGSNLPSSPAGIGNTQADYTVNGILSTDLASYHLDINLNATRLGDTHIAPFDTPLQAPQCHPPGGHPGCWQGAGGLGGQPVAWLWRKAQWRRGNIRHHPGQGGTRCQILDGAELFPDLQGGLGCRGQLGFEPP